MTVSKTGTVTLRYDYHVNDRRETLTLGGYGPGGISLALARGRLLDARKAVEEGRSPAQEKQREKCRLSRAKTFAEFTDVWMEAFGMADSIKIKRLLVW